MTDHFNNIPGVLRPARPWRDDNRLWVHGLYLFHSAGVISYDLQIRGDTANQLLQVVNKAVIIINQ